MGIEGHEAVGVIDLMEQFSVVCCGVAVSYWGGWEAETACVIPRPCDGHCSWAGLWRLWRAFQGRKLGGDVRHKNTAWVTKREWNTEPHGRAVDIWTKAAINCRRQICTIKFMLAIVFLLTTGRPAVGSFRFPAGRWTDAGACSQTSRRWNWVRNSICAWKSCRIWLWNEFKSVVVSICSVVGGSSLHQSSQKVRMEGDPKVSAARTNGFDGSAKQFCKTACR